MAMSDNVPAHHAPARRGSALLVVVLTLGMLGYLAVIVTRSVSGAAIEMNSARAAIQSEADLRAGIELGVAAIRGAGPDMRSANAVADLPGRTITVRITNERGRIDLNVANVAVLAGLLNISKARAADASTLAKGIRDWRAGFEPESVDEVVPNAMNAGFTRRSSANKPATGRVVAARLFSHPLQLAAIPGFTPKLMSDIAPFVTVASGSTQIDPFIAPDPVLLALPGISQDRIQDFRNAPSSKRDAAIRLLGAPATSFTADASSGWRLQIRSRSKSGRERVSEAVIALPKGDSEPYRVLYITEEAEHRVSAVD